MADPAQRRAYTPNEDKVIRLWAAYKTSKRLTAVQAAKLLKYSSSTMTQVEAGTYPSAPDGVLKAMKRVIDNERRRDAAIKDAPFAVTSAYEQVEATCTLCFEGGMFGVIEGPSGAGKTMSVNAFAEKHPGDVILITCSLGYSGEPLLEDIAEHLRLRLHGRIHRKLRQVCEELTVRGKPLIIIDEADKLTSRGFQAGRTVWDDVHCGMIFVGTPDFRANIAKNATGLDQQGFNRFSEVCQVGTVNEEDAEKITRFFNVPMAARRLAFKACGGYARLLNDGMKRAVTIARETGGNADEVCVQAAFMTLRDFRDLSRRA